MAAKIAQEKHLETSETCLKEASVLASADLPEGACNRAYYAAYHMACAAVMALGGPHTKTHRGLQNAFYNSAIKTGRVSMEVGGALHSLMRVRQLADYAGVRLTASDADGAIRDAKVFCDAVRKEVFPEPQPDKEAKRTGQGSKGGQADHRGSR